MAGRKSNTVTQRYYQNDFTKSQGDGVWECERPNDFSAICVWDDKVKARLWFVNR